MEKEINGDTQRQFTRIALCGLILCAVMVGWNPARSQTMIFADSIVSSYETNSVALSVDQDLNTFSEIRAYSGTLLGLGAYSGYLDIAFPSAVPANQTCFVKIETEDDILESLMGGSIGNLLAVISGTALMGNQEFVVEARQNGMVVLDGNSSVPADFSGERLKIVVNQYAETFLAITPDQDYTSIRITNVLGSLIGLSTTKTMRVYGAYYVVNAPPCALPEFTGYDASGLTVDLIQLSGAGASNIHRTIDGDWYSFSELSLGTVSVPAWIEQKVYFEGLSNSGDMFGIRFQVDPQLSVLNVGANISFRAQNGAVVEYTETLANIIAPPMTDSLANGDIVTIYIQPGVPVDRIILRFESVLGVSLDQYVNFYEVFRIAAPPTFNVAGSANTICEGMSASLIADASDPGMDIHWYTDSLSGQMIGTTNSGQAFNTSALTGDTIFYVAGFRPGCPDETVLVPINVWVIPGPDPSDISLSVNPSGYCASDTVLMTPVSPVGSQFFWYLDAQATQPVTDGMVLNGALYSLNQNGELTVTGLTDVNSPYTFYVAVLDSVTLCSSAPGNLAQVTVTINDTPPPSGDTLQSFCNTGNLTLNDLTVTGTGIQWYDAAGNNLSLSEPLTDGMTYYSTQTGALCESSVQLAVLVTILSPDGAQVISSAPGVCAGDTVTYTTQPGMMNYNWSMSGGTWLSGGTPTDNTVTIIWQTPGTYSIDVSYETTSGCEVGMQNQLIIPVDECGGEDVVITKTVDNETPFVGQQIVFTITVQNNGQGSYNNVQVDEQITSGFTYVSHTVTSGSYTPSGGLWNIPVLAPGATETLLITVTVNAEGNHVNVATIITDIPGDIDPGNNTSSVEASPDCFMVYNEITPNSDGMNDYLIIDCIENYPGNAVTIYNRYGNAVYDIKGYQNDWSGVANVSGVVRAGEVVPSGTYYYVLVVEEENFETAGWIYILR